MNIPDQPTRLAEILGSLSLATDLADGQSMGAAMGATVLSTRIGRALGLGSEQLAEVYYACICRFLGCTSTASDTAAIALGDEMSINHAYTVCDLTNPEELRRNLEENFAVDKPDEARRAIIDYCISLGPSIMALALPHCEQAGVLTARLPVPDAVPTILSTRSSRWDGLNPVQPGGEDLHIGSRIVEFAVVMELHRRAGGNRSMVEVASARSGTQFDPTVCEAFVGDVAAMVDGLGGDAEWEAFLNEEPGQHRTVAASEVQVIAEAFADFIDTKSRWFLGHSRRVAALAKRAALDMGLDKQRCALIFNAGLLHDIGKASLPNGILDKPTQLTRREQTRMDACTYYTEQVLSASPVFDDLRDIAVSVHERCDGSGSHRRIRLRDDDAGIVAVANLYDELTHDTPTRPALGADEAAELLLTQASDGCLPREATRAILGVIGHRKKMIDRVYPDGLTQREADVLRLIAKGLANKEIADELQVSVKTADNHTTNLYRKIGAQSRTVATLYALEKGFFVL